MTYADEGPLHDWPSLAEDWLREYASTFVGWATNEMSDPADLAWALEPIHLDTFLGLETDWDAYYREEISENPRYDQAFAIAEYLTPIVISIEHGLPIIWDGWHRIACAIHRGDRTLLSVTGRTPRTTSGKTTS